jgi:hypothetical protein
MTKEQAEGLAKHDKEYRVRLINTRWVVWCDASDRAVEFDERTIANAKISR